VGPRPLTVRNRAPLSLAGVSTTCRYHWRSVAPDPAVSVLEPGGFGVTDVHLEECESGRIGRSRKPLWSQGHRGFESHLLRQLGLTKFNRVQRDGGGLLRASVAESATYFGIAFARPRLL
jgi:hypothetical protein